MTPTPTPSPEVTFSQTKYDAVINSLKAVVAGTTGWISLTEAARECGADKKQLAIMAKHLGLRTDNHGRYGLVARKAA